MTGEDLATGTSPACVHVDQDEMWKSRYEEALSVLMVGTHSDIWFGKLQHHWEKCERKIIRINCFNQSVFSFDRMRIWKHCSKLPRFFSNPTSSNLFQSSKMLALRPCKKTSLQDKRSKLLKPPIPSKWVVFLVIQGFGWFDVRL